MGKEVVPQAERVLNAIAELHGGIAFDFTSFPRSCEYYLEHGTMMPDDGLETLQHFDALFLGAVGAAHQDTPVTTSPILICKRPGR